jgi:transposase
METNGSIQQPLTATNGRPMKFTPERMQQIKNLVERGMSREQIAETIGVTLGSLQVTCSRMGISLRRPRPDNSPPSQRGEAPDEAPKREAEVKLALRNRDRLIELPLSQDMLGRLAIESHFANLSISEMTAKLIAAAIEIDLFEKLRDRKCPRT